MKYRIDLLKEYLLYLFFNRKFLLSLVWGICFLYVIFGDNSMVKIGEIVITATIFSFAIYRFLKYYGRILAGYCSPKKTQLTMRGISPRKLKEYENEEISRLFLEDFQCILRNREIKTDIIINTHTLYAQGVLDLIYKMYDPEKKGVKISVAAENNKCICNGVEISVEKREKHINHMAAIKIPLTAKQEEIRQFFRKKYDYYKICIPKELFM